MHFYLEIFVVISVADQLGNGEMICDGVVMSMTMVCSSVWSYISLEYIEHDALQKSSIIIQH